jgi:Flp pilus assembly protein TadD
MGTISGSRCLGLAMVLAVTCALTACSHHSIEGHLMAGYQAMRNKQFAKAETEFQQAVKIAPNDPRGHMALGNFYLDEQKFDPAELEFMKVLMLDPHNAAAHHALGLVYRSQSKLGLAESQFRAAIALAPTDVDYRLDLGNVLRTEAKYPQAEAQLRTAVGLDPRNPHAHLALAQVLSAEPNRAAEANAEYAEVRALDPALIQPAATPAAPAAASTTAAALDAAPPKVHPANKRFLLTHNSPVYLTTSQSSQVLAEVHHGKWVHVTGISGNWFRIRMRNGTLGFIPVSAAE